MKKLNILILIAILLLIAEVTLMVFPEPEIKSAELKGIQNQLEQRPADSQQTPVRTTQKQNKQNLDAVTTKEIEVDIFDRQAIDSLRNARINGDSRSPTIGKSPQRDLPNQEELENPDLYLSFQSRKKLKVKQAYIKAAKPKIAQLKKLIEEGKIRGISDEKLKEGQEKVIALEEMVKEIEIELQDN